MECKKSIVNHLISFIAGQLKQLKELKKNNPDLKILVSVGGYLEGSVKFSEMAKTSSKKDTFIKSIIKFIRYFKFIFFDN